MQVALKIALAASEYLQAAFGIKTNPPEVQIQDTRKEFTGDLTLVVFPFVKAARQSPENMAHMLGKHIQDTVDEVDSYNVIKGFLNLSLSPAYWLDFLQREMHNKSFGLKDAQENDRPVVVEFSSPNTNKPLHLGHIRNNLLGDAVSRLVAAGGKSVRKVNLVNDRGIHICKSMLAWMKYGRGETPESTGKKGDKLTGDYYVRFETELKKQVAELIQQNQSEITPGNALPDEETLRQQAPLMQEARELLRKWEEGDPQTIEIWKQMNQWVYQGFDTTYGLLGISFDKIYYESETYLLGRKLVKEGLEKGVFYRREDGSVWVDLSDQKLDEKLLLRGDGTSVYMTQDLGTAQLRYDDYKADQMIYVVGNEQNYHFDVLKKVLQKLDKPYANSIFHLSYGMVELPQGKMKSREGTVVDADDLIAEMTRTAKETTEALGKTNHFTEEEKSGLYHMLAMGALKYFILKVDPKKNMLFNPEESIDFNGHTGPFIQYAHARIRSVMRAADPAKSSAEKLSLSPDKINEKERRVLKTLHAFPEIIEAASHELNPATLANYLFELAREYNQFYHEYSVLNEPDEELSLFRLKLSALTAQVLQNGMGLLGIEVPERM